MSYASAAGIPLFVVVVAATHHYLMPYVQNRFSVTGLGIALGICLFYVLRGVDKWFDQKRDNPKPLESPQVLEEVFGNVIAVLENRHVGPYFWGIRYKNQDERRIQASLNFTEQHQLIGHQPTTLNRCILFDLWLEALELPQDQREEVNLDSDSTNDQVEEVDLENSDNEADKDDDNDDNDDDDDSDDDFEALNLARFNKKPLTKIHMTWNVDSPMNRSLCNTIIEDLTDQIKEATGLGKAPEKEKPSIFQPPVWALCLLGIAAYYCFQDFEAHMKRVETARAQRQAQIEKQQKEQAEINRQRQELERRRQEQQRQWKEQRENYRNKYQNPLNYPNQNNSFAPILTPHSQPEQRRTYKPKEPDYRKKQDKGTSTFFKPIRNNTPKKKERPSTLDPYYKPSTKKQNTDPFSFEPTKKNDSNKVKWRSTYGTN